MKVLVCSTAYPTLDGGRAMYYVHSRNIYYLKENIDVVVLNFRADKNYCIDGISVITLEEYKKNPISADLLICHAANIRNHYTFLKKYGDLYKKKVFFVHGHEVLHINKYYPEPYYYIKRSVLKKNLQDLYDDYKIRTWRKYYLQNLDNIKIIFVSNWILNQFCSEFKIKKSEIEKSVAVIPNSVGEFFEHNSYTLKEKKYDFLTIRNYLDGSNYCADIVVDIAKKNPHYKFCIIGKGEFFKHYECPKNVTYIEKELTHDEMRGYMDSSVYALLPTREDTQGLMACEFATYGMPLITSDIDVCKEVFDSCENVAFISNKTPNIDIAMRKLQSNRSYDKWRKYFADNTIKKEIEFLKWLVL